MQLAKLEQIKTAVYVSSSRVEKRPVTGRPGWGGRPRGHHLEILAS